MQDVHQLGGLDLNLALLLHALLAERSVSRAGKRLGLSQSATSHALARLRATLGDPLLVRTPDGLVPTSRAAAMAEPLASGLSLLGQALVGAPRFDAATAARRFQLAATDYAELQILPRLLRSLTREAPGVELAVHALSDDSLPALRRGDLDLVIGVFPAADVGAGLVQHALIEDRFVCLVRAGHPLARRRLTLARFVAARHALIAPRGRPGGPIDSALAARGLQRRIAVTVPHFVVAPYVVAETDLILTLSERVAREFAARLPLRILEPPLPLPRIKPSMLWHERNVSDAAHRWLREHIAAAARATR